MKLGCKEFQNSLRLFTEIFFADTEGKGGTGPYRGRDRGILILFSHVHLLTNIQTFILSFVVSGMTTSYFQQPLM